MPETSERRERSREEGRRMSIRTTGLTVKIRKQVLIQPLDLVVQACEFVGILGPSGCGKSTLLRSLAGIQAATGEVMLDGKPASSQRVGFVPQDDVVHGALTVEKALRYTGRLLGLSGTTLEERLEAVIVSLDLGERRKVPTQRLSGGQRKRVSIGVELMANPGILFLDEPTAGLDPALEESFMESCQQLARQGRTVLMSTHVMQSLERLDLVLILQKGYLVFLGKPEEALSFFGVQQLTQIYRPLAQQDPAQAHQRYRASAYFQSYVEARKASP